MFAQQEENGGDNGFELVDRPKEGNPTEGIGTEPGPNWVAQPLNLPVNLVTAPQPLFLPPGQLFPSTSTPVVLPGPILFNSPTPITPLTQGIPAPMPLLLPEIVPVSPPVTANLQQSPLPPLEVAVLESPTDTNPNPEDLKSSAEPSKAGGLFNWVKDAIPGKGILARAAEKARSSIDTMITTLDPQMKEFIYSGGDIDIVVTSTKEVKVSPVREAFQHVFGKATVRGVESQNYNVALQPVGFTNALQSADERIQFVRSNGMVSPQQMMVSVEGFAVELYNNNWFEINCLVLNDPVRNLRLETFTQPLAIPAKAVLRMQNSTPSAYPLRQSGFSITVGEAISQELTVPATEWQAVLTGVSRRDVLLLAAKTLASALKSTIGSQQ